MSSLDKLISKNISSELYLPNLEIKSFYYTYIKCVLDVYEKEKEQQGRKRGSNVYNTVNRNIQPSGGLQPQFIIIS
jgi:hypothetical protein